MNGSRLLEKTAELVDIPSISHDERAIADHVQQLLEDLPHLEVTRVGDNVLARTALGHPQRLLLAGHLDTVPANGNEHAHIDDDVLWGLGAADMKGGLAVMIETLRSVTSPTVDITFIGYVCEEVDQRFSGLGEIERVAPDWLAGDAAVLGEPTASLVEAGCQGVLRVAVTVRGERAHTARPWMGLNAIHRLAGVLERVASFEGRRPVLDGCEYREALQAVSVEGGVAGNVVPDSATLLLNHRFAPDRDTQAAFAAVQEFLVDTLDARLGDHITLEASATAAAPGLSHPLLGRLVQATGQEPRAKLGWTDVSFFSERGIPACNFGPGEPTLAHSAAERVARNDLDQAYVALRYLVTAGSDSGR